jgi:hypothetical protein
MEVTLQINKQLYSIGETLDGDLIVKNNTDEDVTYHFPSACKYGLRILNNDIVVYEMPETCAAVVTKLTIKSGDKISFKISQKLWDKQYKDLSVGIYLVEGFLLKNYSYASQKTIEIK